MPTFYQAPEYGSRDLSTSISLQSLGFVLELGFEAFRDNGKRRKIDYASDISQRPSSTFLHQRSPDKAFTITKAENRN